MTPDQLPPLPEPYRPYQPKILFSRSSLDAVPATFLADQMTAYGLQCAEAAVERERARCLLETESMLETLDLAGEDSGKSHRVYAAGLLKFVAGRIRK